MHFDHANFFVSRHGQAHGPMSWPEVRSYIAYGSVRPTDLLRSESDSQWLPAIEWVRIVEGASEEDEVDHEAGRLSGWRLWLHKLKRSLVTRKGRSGEKPPVRRRIVRFREWESVPLGQRSSVILTDMILGFIFFPPRLWSACSKVFSQHIFRPAKDEEGFLKLWPQAMETVCSVLIVVNVVWWLTLLVGFQQYVLPVLTDAGKSMFDSIESWLMEKAH